MALITQEELLKLATLSCIKLETDEVEPLRQSLEAVLEYASRLKGIAAQYHDSLPGAAQESEAWVNVFRQDHALLCTQPLVESARVHENNYFVVPVIIKQS